MIVFLYKADNPFKLVILIIRFNHVFVFTSLSHSPDTSEARILRLVLLPRFTRLMTSRTAPFSGWKPKRGPGYGISSCIKGWGLHPTMKI